MPCVGTTIVSSCSGGSGSLPVITASISSRSSSRVLAYRDSPDAIPTT
jgi:hypothetical protein